MNLDIRHELNKFQSKIMDDWAFERKHNIGVSIQLFKQVQDKYSETRRDPVNSFCRGVVKNKTQLKKCDLLDVNLKNKSKELHNMRIACRCHKGVSNILIPFEFRGIVWYIFYGQFLLVYSTKPSELTNVKGAFKRYFNRKLNDNQIKHNIEDFKNQYVQENAFIDLDNLPQQFENHDLSKVELFEFFEFKLYVEFNFKAFLTALYADPIKEKVLREFIKDEKNNIEQATLVLQRLFDIHKKWHFTDNQLKENSNNILQGLFENIELFTSRDLNLLENLLDGEGDGTIFNPDWMIDAGNLLRKINLR
jgi:hypothetical protein